MAGKVAEAANGMFASIGAIQTLVENFPMNFISFKELKFSTSFDIIAITSEFNSEFDIEIPIDELEPYNYNTVENIWKLIQRLQEED